MLLSTVLVITCTWILTVADDGSDFTPEDILSYLSANYRRDAKDVNASSYFLPPRGLITVWTDEGDTYKLDLTSKPGGGTEGTYKDAMCNDDLCYIHIDHIIGGYTYKVQVTSDKKKSSSVTFYLPWQLTTESSSDGSFVEWDMSFDDCTKAIINPLCYADDGHAAAEVTILQSKFPVERKIQLSSIHLKKVRERLSGLHDSRSFISPSREGNEGKSKPLISMTESRQQVVASKNPIARGVKAAKKMASSIMKTGSRMARKSWSTLSNWQSKLREKVKERLNGLYLNNRKAVKRTFSEEIQRTPGIYIRRPPRFRNPSRKHGDGAPWWSFGDNGNAKEDDRRDHYSHYFFDFFGEEYPSSKENGVKTVGGDHQVFFEGLQEAQYYMITLIFTHNENIKVIVKTKLKGSPINTLPQCNDTCYNGGRCVSSVLGLGRTELDSVFLNSCSCPSGFAGVNCAEQGTGDVHGPNGMRIQRKTLMEHAEFSLNDHTYTLPSAFSLAQYWCNGKQECSFLFPRMQSYFSEADPCRYASSKSYNLKYRTSFLSPLSCEHDQIMHRGTCYGMVSEGSFTDAIDKCHQHGGDLSYMVPSLPEFLKRGFWFERGWWTYGPSPVSRPPRLRMAQPESAYVTSDGVVVKCDADLCDESLVAFCAFPPL